MLRASTHGFTLLEIMVGMSILALGLMVTTSSLVTAFDSRDITTDRDLALVEMEGTLEDILTHLYADIDDFEGFYPITGLTPPEGRDEVLEVRMEDQAGVGRISRITLEATWDRRGTTYTETLVYIHTNRGG